MTAHRFDSKNRDFSGLNYAYAPHSKGHNTFDLRADCVANFVEQDIENFNYVSLVTEKKYSGKVRISTRCKFEKFGAPLIVFSNDMSLNPDGSYLYGLHFECVAYEGGLNMWRIVPDPSNTARPIATKKIAFTEFEVPAGSTVDMVLEIDGQTMTAYLNGNKLYCTHPEIPEEFHVGITACEGPNLFYDLVIEEI